MTWRSALFSSTIILLFEGLLYKSDEANRNKLVDYFRESPLEDIEIRLSISLNPEQLKLPDLAESSQIQTNYELNRINQGLICQYKVDYYSFSPDCYFQMDLIISDNDAISIYENEPIIDLYHQLQSIRENDLPFFVSQAALYHLLESELESLAANHYTRKFTGKKYVTIPNEPIDLETVCVNDTSVIRRLSKVTVLNSTICENRSVDSFLSTVTPNNLKFQVDKAIRLKFLQQMMSFYGMLLQINQGENKYKEKHNLFRNVLQRRKEAVELFNSNHWDEALTLLNQLSIDNLPATNYTDSGWWLRSGLYGLILMWQLIFQ
ncbi:Hypothetical protein PP7435_CHR2-0895 [Komagataella phaffii CBS 7435]|uniref:Uncharacterized protein n=2 Tax=Komagataella phaffii TaxID=460519 RepID=C4R0K2_KOMPG|nr:Hypothetical protein PAS_chr2-1_0405 [Komagataella phaffii GS115]AOA62899.1 GQ67_00445T0 [Komagataella phaffii]CAH2448456.1 Hypothetical protein BQ9382_C2-4820 [Komagataella phaffii CBS 7435]AOA67429.1 GQ68_00944T0 [Komagataella phaffii GS115]CAY69026.1 Hypothetical protein PAS_chr2-1_0405 [Komagataella phaffii GS115]CCA38577.1 Hypothetical protein PP7435_CHR2-0895 [Komagataella phaffii CBS 7435]